MLAEYGAVLGTAAPGSARRTRARSPGRATNRMLDEVIAERRATGRRPDQRPWRARARGRRRFRTEELVPLCRMLLIAGLRPRWV